MRIESIKVRKKHDNLKKFSKRSQKELELILVAKR